MEQIHFVNEQFLEFQIEYKEIENIYIKGDLIKLSNFIFLSFSIVLILYLFSH